MKLEPEVIAEPQGDAVNGSLVEPSRGLRRTRAFA